MVNCAIFSLLRNVELPNSLASRSTPEGGSGSGGTGETPSHYRAVSGEPSIPSAAEPLPAWSKGWAASCLEILRLYADYLT